LIRAAGFLLFASAYWALLPLVVRNQIGGGPMLYGICARSDRRLGRRRCLPAAVAQRSARSRQGGGSGTLGTAAATALFGLAHDDLTALAASLLAGVSWMTMLSVLTISAQYALPEWVRGRGLAIYVTVMFGALSLGSGHLGASGYCPRPWTGRFSSPQPDARSAFLCCGAGNCRRRRGWTSRRRYHWPLPVMTGDFDAHRDR